MVVQVTKTTIRIIDFKENKYKDIHEDKLGQTEIAGQFVVFTSEKSNALKCVYIEPTDVA